MVGSDKKLAWNLSPGFPRQLASYRLSAPAAILSFLVGLLVAAWGPSLASAAGCPNESFRTGPSANLPDCRAYELVTPPDTNGRLVGAIETFGGPLQVGGFPTELMSPSGRRFAYLSYTSPLLSPGEANGTTDLYKAERTEAGWVTVRQLNPPGSVATMPVPGGIASDHLYATTRVGNDLSSMALGGETDYLVNPDGTYELIGVGSLGTEPFVRTRWITEGGAHVVFATGHAIDQSNACKVGCEVRQLEPDAAPTGTGAIYDRPADGPTHVVSLLPGDVLAGTGQEAFYKGTSKDASSIAFGIEGVLYVRVHNGDAPNEETLEVAGASPTFAGLSDEGRYLFYLAAGNIHRFDTEAGGSETINATGDAKVVAVSGDGSHVYYVSESQINGEGALGQPNLYVWSGGAAKYIATVLPSDLEGTPGLAMWTTAVVGISDGETGPGASTARTTPDGTVLVFESDAPLTSYDNGDHTEIYRYEDGKGLICISCNPAVEPAASDARLQDLAATSVATVIHNVTDDGNRIFFETPEALVSRDTSGVNDIYEWREEEGVAELSLISSGQSIEYKPADSPFPFKPSANVLLSVTPDGRDVAFLAQDILVSGAGQGGTTAIWDARVDGGFPAPQSPAICSEEQCRLSQDASLPLVAPQSETTAGSGNVKPRKRHRHCRRRARHRRHGHCTRHRGSKRSLGGGGRSSSSVAKQRDSSGGHRSAQAGPEFSTSAVIPPAVDAPVDAAPVSTRLTSFAEFGFESAAASESTSAAAMHPDFKTVVTLNHRIDEKTGRPEADAKTEEISVSLPPGLVGNPLATPRCSTGQFIGATDCPPDTQIGVATVETLLVDGKVPLYNLEPPHPESEVARLGFLAGFGYPVFIDVEVRTASDYGVTATVHSAPSLDALVSAETTVWGNPADPSHDEERFTLPEAFQCPGTACKAPGGKRPSGIEIPKPFLTNPSACQEQSVGFEMKSYQLPGQAFLARAPLPPITNCSGLHFTPSFEAQPTSRVAGAPTGLSTILTLPQMEDPSSAGSATMREARVTLPPGMQIAAGAANWIGTCSEEQVGLHREVEAACPDASKLGTVTLKSPALSRPLQGYLFQRTPFTGHQFGLWLASDDLGLHVKLPGEIEPDPGSGRLTAVFRDLPQVPVSEIKLDVWGGPKAPLENPDSCGTYTTNYSFAPHSNDPAVSGQSQMTIDQGCDQGFSPTLRAGVTEPIAGRFSPFVFDLLRDDGQQALRGFELHLPDGELAKIAGVPLCPDAAAAAGSCPEGSRIGSLQAAVGPGPDPLWIPQSGKAQPAVYLAGPYQGSPFSIVSEVPAQAGPFDLGVVVVRSALHVDPETARATVKADPLPQFFEGVGITYRRLHAVIDRPEFSLNPTDCREMAVTAEAMSTQGTAAHPAARFQVDGCKALKFKPRISLSLKGGTKRSDYPALSALVGTRKGDANIGRVSVALPHSEFLAQEHINTICTRKRYAAHDCPKGSIYGRAKAWTPLLDNPLAGPVYLRSSNNPLPDLVMALGGELDIALVGRIDSIRGGIRTTFEAVPDAPVAKFVLKMRGGKKSLLTNSQDICRGVHRADVKMRAQNGRIATPQPVLKSSGCARGKSRK